MKILNMYATFGKLNEKVLSFSDGMNVIHGANEAGKSTWSAFIRAMLYGISTSEKTKIGHMADKEKYAPWSGAPMYGKIEFLWQGKKHILEREANRSGILQKAKIIEVETGKELDIPEPVGETLLGIRREVFERTAFIAQSSLAVSADKTGELEKRIVALATTGEENFSQTQVIENLEKQRRKIKNYKRGEIPELEAELSAVSENLNFAHEYTRQLNLQYAEINRLEEEEAKAEQNAENIRIIEAKKTLSYIEACEREREECALSLEELKKEKCLTEAQSAQIEEKLKQYEEKELNYTNCTAKLHTEQEKLETLSKISVNKALPFILASSLAVIFGVVAALFLKWFAVLPIAAIVFLISYFISKAAYLKKKGVKSFAEIAEKNEEYSIQKQRITLLTDEKTAVEKEKASAEERLKTVLSMVNIRDPQDAREKINQAREILKLIAETELTLSGLSAKAEASKNGRDIDQLKELAAKNVLSAEKDQPILRETDDIRAERNKRGELLAALKEKIAVIGEPGALENKITELSEKLLQKEKEYTALTLAIDTLTDIQTELQRRFAPSVEAKAGEIFKTLTGDHFSVVQIRDADMNLSVSESKASPPRTILELSGGTLDELYLAVRLALCEKLLADDVPIVLDDAFVNFDDERMERALNLLKEMARDRQVLVFTCHTREKVFAEANNLTYTTL